MPTTRINVGRKVATPLFELERALDAALAKAGELSIALANAPAEARINPISSQSVLRHIGLIHSALIEARGHTVATHMSLDEVRAALGLPEHAYGDVSPKVPAFTEARRGHLQAVELQAVA